MQNGSSATRFRDPIALSKQADHRNLNDRLRSFKPTVPRCTDPFRPMPVFASGVPSRTCFDEIELVNNLDTQHSTSQFSNKEVDLDSLSNPRPSDGSILPVQQEAQRSRNRCAVAFDTVKRTEDCGTGWAANAISITPRPITKASVQEYLDRRLPSRVSLLCTVQYCYATQK